MAVLKITFTVRLKMDVGNLEHFLFADNDGSHFADMVVDSMYSWHVGDKHEE